MHTGDSHVRTLWADRECPVCFWLACTCVDVNLSRILFTWLIAASTMMYCLRQLDISGDDDSNHSRHPGRWLVVNVSRTIYGTTFSSSRSIISISNLYVILKSRRLTYIFIFIKYTLMSFVRRQCLCFICLNFFGFFLFFLWLLFCLFRSFFPWSFHVFFCSFFPCIFLFFRVFFHSFFLCSTTCFFSFGIFFLFYMFIQHSFFPF